jgi:hypothetical protein
LFLTLLLLTLRAQIAKQRLDALVIALNCRSRAVKLEEARHHLQCQKRHACLPLQKELTESPSP